MSVVFFFDPQSSDSLHEVSFLDALNGRAKDFGLAIWAIEASGRQPAEVSRAMERYCAVYGAPSFAILPDPSYRTGRTYGVRRAPTTFVAEQPRRFGTWHRQPRKVNKTEMEQTHGC